MSNHLIMYLFIYFYFFTCSVCIFKFHSCDYSDMLLFHMQLKQHFCILHRMCIYSNIHFSHIFTYFAHIMIAHTWNICPLHCFMLCCHTHPPTHPLSSTGNIVPWVQFNTFHCGCEEILKWYKGHLANRVSFVQSELTKKKSHRWLSKNGVSVTDLYCTTVLPRLIIMVKRIKTSFWKLPSPVPQRCHCGLLDYHVFGQNWTVRVLFIKGTALDPEPSLILADDNPLIIPSSFVRIHLKHSGWIHERNTLFLQNRL